MIAATRAGVDDQDSSASRSTTPRLNGNKNHNTRAGQSNGASLSSATEGVRILRTSMGAARLRGGVATAIGSLPHVDAIAASELVLGALPDLPCAPQLPIRSPLEGMLAAWLRALPEVMVSDDGELELCTPPAESDARFATIDTTFSDDAHGGLLTFLDVASQRDDAPRAVKVQVTGPLTLGLALHQLGMPSGRAYGRAAQCSAAWARAVVDLVHRRLPNSEVVLFFDEPGLVAWADDAADPALDEEVASDLLSATLATVDCMVGVHVCGEGALEIALSAGPDIVGVEAKPWVTEHAVALARLLDRGGFLAWGAVPTDRPIGEQPTQLWKALVELWCELTRRGCDPVKLRQQALITPACGLALHGAGQAEHALDLSRALAERVHGQAVATRLGVGA
jgi:hypothetical protein